MKVGTVLVAVLVVGGCAKGKTPAPAVVTIDSQASAQAAVGKRVRVEGIGDNAKLGAVVTKNDLVVYCSDRPDGWATANQAVVVEGVLESTAAPKARTGADGTISAGTGGPIFRMACTQK